MNKIKCCISTTTKRKVTMDDSKRGTDAKQPTIADTDSKKAGPSTVKEWREHYLNMSLEEKREQYKCGSGNQVELTSTDIQRWPDYAKYHNIRGATSGSKFNCDKELNEKIAIFRGDITTLEIDAIVNAANRSLLGGGGVDGAIHRAAGKRLLNECRELNGCPTGEAKTTGGYKLPAKYIIHTVGPMGEDSKSLKSCYENCLRELTQLELRSIAFPCVSTGIYGYDNGKAADVVLRTVREWLEKADNRQKVDIIVFCLFMDVDKKYYETKLPIYFPLTSGGKPADTNREGSQKGATTQRTRSQSPEVLPQVESVDSQADDSAAESEGAEAGDKSAKLEKQVSDVRKDIAQLSTGNTQPTASSTKHAGDEIANDAEAVENVRDADNTKTSDNTQPHTSDTQYHVSDTQPSTDKSQQVSADDTQPSNIDSATQSSVHHTDTLAESAGAEKLDETKPSNEESCVPRAESAKP